MNKQSKKESIAEKNWSSIILNIIIKVVKHPAPGFIIHPLGLFKDLDKRFLIGADEDGHISCHFDEWHIFRHNFLVSFIIVDYDDMNSFLFAARINTRSCYVFVCTAQ